METNKSKSSNILSRRDFIRNVSLAAASAVAGNMVEKVHGSDKTTEKPNTPKILNYNPKMGYRRLGKTEMIISEIGLGGHWKNRKGERYWNTFDNDEVPLDVVKNRTEVIRACIDAGINYLDIGTSAECLAYGVVLKGRRDRMYISADDRNLCLRNEENCTVEKLMFDIDQCCRRLQTDYLDVWRVKADMYGKSTDVHIHAMLETFEKAHKAGKVRHLGISSHRRPWLQQIIEKYPQIEMVSFPYTATTKRKWRPPGKDNAKEVNASFGSDNDQNIFQAINKQDIGLVTIKPFLGGQLFKRKTKFPVKGRGSNKENRLALLTLQCILLNKAITATIPGLSTVHEVEIATRASHTLRDGLTMADMHWVMSQTNQQWATLPQEYCWLKDWQVV